MSQSWKTLLLVVIGAAILGWVTVRVLGGGRHEPTVVQTAALASPAPGPPAATVTAGATPPLDAPVSPAAASPAAPPPPPAEGDESEVIGRELEMLARALVTDQRVADLVMPRVNDVLDVPSTAQYRRAPDFWQPALAATDEKEMTQ